MSHRDPSSDSDPYTWGQVAAASALLAVSDAAAAAVAVVSAPVRRRDIVEDRENG